MLPPYLLGLAAAATLLSLAPSFAQEGDVVALGDGSSLSILDYQIEVSGAGDTTVVVLARPNFDPEPYGAAPSDDFARIVQPLCAGLVQNSRAAIIEENATAVRVRWDFEPSYDTGAPDAITITRFHEFLFALDENLMCIPRPLGVGLDNLQPNLPSGLPVSLRYIEPGPRARQVTLTYEVGEDLASVSREVLENAGIELCILHADLVLADRRKYYSQIETELVALAFVESDGRGMELERRIFFGVKDHQCNTGLSADLVDLIRSGSLGGDPVEEKGQQL